MIKIGSLRKSDVGRYVKYTPIKGKPETGRIKSWNVHWVFVVYKCDKNWKLFRDYTAIATSYKQLDFIEGKEQDE